MRVGVIGLGRMGQFYAEALARLGAPTTLAAVVDPKESVRTAVQERLGVETACADVADALERADVDAVVVATTTSEHARVVVAAAQRGKPIFCEKPLALTVAETQHVLREVERTGVLLQIGFMRRFDPPHVRAKHAIEAGEIGRPLTYRSVGRDPGCPPVAFADPRHSGGLIVDMGIHDFDMARWLTSSEVERVSAEGDLLVCDELRQVGDIDNAIVLMRFASGAVGTIEVSRTARYGYDIQAEVLGSEAAIRIGPSSARGLDDMERLPPEPPSQDPIPPFVRRFASAYTAQIVDFIRCVQEDRPPRAGGADALAAIRIAEAATLAAQTGAPVTIREEITQSG